MGTAVLGKRSQALDFGPVYELFSTVVTIHGSWNNQQVLSGACSRTAPADYSMKPGSGHPTLMSKTSLRKQTEECVSTGFANAGGVTREW